MPTQSEPDAARIWRAGAFDEKRGARYLSVSGRTFLRIAKREKWPRKRIKGTTRIVYPRSLIVAFLAGCEEA